MLRSGSDSPPICRQSRSCSAHVLLMSCPCSAQFSHCVDNCFGGVGFPRHVSCCAQILKRGCGVNDRDGLTDMTLLHYCCKAGAPGIGECTRTHFDLAEGNPARLDARVRAAVPPGSLFARCCPRDHRWPISRPTDAFIKRFDEAPFNTLKTATQK